MHTQNRPAKHTDANNSPSRFLQVYNVQPVTRGPKQMFPYSIQAGLPAYRSWFVNLRIGRLPGKGFPLFPVTYWLLLPNYGDEFVQDLHLFPFSPKPMLISMHCSDTCMLFIQL